MKIAWLTDAQAPYREPLFCELADRCDFRVHFLFAEEPERHFRFRPHPGYSSGVLPSVPIPYWHLTLRATRAAASASASS